MKALSIKQPFATLIVEGKKDREHRTWNTKFRGRFLVVSSKKQDKGFVEEFGFNEFAFNCGYIVGSVELYGVEDYGNGVFAFLLKSFKEYGNPIKYKGQLSFYDIPYEIIKEQEEQS